jgi:hypothetical protein
MILAFELLFIEKKEERFLMDQVRPWSRVNTAFMQASPRFINYFISCDYRHLFFR